MYFIFKHCLQWVPKAVLNREKNFVMPLKVNPNRKLKIQQNYDYQIDWAQSDQTTEPFVSSYDAKLILTMQSFYNDAELQTEKLKSQAKNHY